MASSICCAAAARKWASGCLLSGECIKACDYGVKPRFLLGMARVAMAKAKDDAAMQRRAGVEGFRVVARDVIALSRLQLDEALLLSRLGQVPKQSAAGELPDFVFYTGCNVLKTPHIALLALDVMDALGISYEVMGGPTHCCGGVQQLRAGDLTTFKAWRRREHASTSWRAARPSEAGAVVVPVVPGAIHRNDAAHRREDRGAQRRST